MNTNTEFDWKMVWNSKVLKYNYAQCLLKVSSLYSTHLWKGNAVVKGLSSESESDDEETLSYFRQDARLTFYTLKDGKFLAYKE